MCSSEVIFSLVYSPPCSHPPQLAYGFLQNLLSSSSSLIFSIYKYITNIVICQQFYYSILSSILKTPSQLVRIRFLYCSISCFMASISRCRFICSSSHPDNRTVCVEISAQAPVRITGRKREREKTESRTKGREE